MKHEKHESDDYTWLASIIVSLTMVSPLIYHWL